MACSDIVFARLVTFTQYGVNAVQNAIAIPLRRNQARFKFHLRVLRQFDRFPWPENAAFIDCVDHIHVLLLLCNQ